ncbi:Protein of unknown function [Amycolatopsis arida]|uniref:TNT domain-containing protein n=1 Tax=Amycolatopsis arida TaxID=587909 RepID=A0A1I5WW75_9PSEU|nr:glycohydrolase toxin TNT-related protein [Amycolatopsis arida]TDX92475.1 uncharacterized protein DUF4237 [Amycolatopsis arida]SFQ23776.1 Protein of unknown function [Amycolatopsis arida]
MAQATQLNATEQDTLVKQIGLALLRAAPRDWRRVVAEYRAVGRYHELTGEVTTQDGSVHEWVATHDIATLFGRLRAGMYREGRGTWFNARYQLDHPSSYNLEYDREEPNWDLVPPPQAYADELRMFPRSEENVPEWLMRRMSGLGPERPGPRFRIARIFDGVGPGGRPLINRPDLDVDEQDRLLEYLDNAPVVVPGRGYDVDRLATTPEATVPVAFHSDGNWIWPAAVNYYLREYGVSPEPDLVQHIQAAGHTVPEVPEPLRQAAAAHISRGAPPARPAPPAPPPPPVAAPPPPVPAPPGDGRYAAGGGRSGGAAEEAPGRHEQPDDYADDGHGQPDFEGQGFAEDRHAEPAGESRDYESPGSTDSSGFESAGHGSSGYESPGHAEATTYAEPAEREVSSPPPPPAVSAAPASGSTPASAPGSTEAGRNASEYGADASGYDADEAQLTRITPAVSAHAATPAEPISLPGARGEEPADDVDQAERGDHTRYAEHEDGGAEHDLDDGGPPTQAGAPPLPPVSEDAEPVLEQLRDKLQELGVPASEYRLGRPIRRGWSLEEVGSGWRVGWYDGELTNPAMFGDVDDAAAFLLGKLLLAPEGGVAAHGTGAPRGAAAGGPATAGAGGPAARQPAHGAPSGQPAHGAPSGQPAGTGAPGHGRGGPSGAPGQVGGPGPKGVPGPPKRVTAMLSPEVAVGGRPAPAGAEPEPARPVPGRDAGEPPQRAARPAGAPVPPAAGGGLAAGAGATGGRPAAGGGGQQQWPIQPLEGEPPLTLFRGKEIRELPVGSELDRFGGPNGNLTYAAGTPFEERSLVPEWVNRPYHVYRVQRPLEALHGVAIPWFNQPGGGAAYLLPASIEELLASGDLIELEPGEPPID